MHMKFIAAAAILLLLTGCGQKEQPKAPDPVPEDPVVEEVVTPEPAPEESDVIQVPIEINPDVPACEDGVEPAAPSVEHETVLVEDLVEDMVGYTLEKPVFQGLNGADKINSFYDNLISNLENFCKSQIYTDAVNKSGIASVYGTVDFARMEQGLLQVQYTFRAEFSDDTEQKNVRIDSFDPETGETVEKEGNV